MLFPGKITQNKKKERLNLPLTSYINCKKKIPAKIENSSFSFANLLDFSIARLRLKDYRVSNISFCTIKPQLTRMLEE